MVGFVNFSELISQQTVHVCHTLCSFVPHLALDCLVHTVSRRANRGGLIRSQEFPKLCKIPTTMKSLFSFQSHTMKCHKSNLSKHSKQCCRYLQVCFRSRRKQLVTCVEVYCCFFQYYFFLVEIPQTKGILNTCNIDLIRHDHLCNIGNIVVFIFCVKLKDKLK